MKNTMRIIALCLLAVMMLALFVGCSSEEKQFIGTWYLLDEEGNKTSSTLVLAKDGEGTISEEGISGSVKWSLNNGKLSLTVSICGMSETEEYSYEFSGDKLILTDSEGKVTTHSK